MNSMCNVVPNLVNVQLYTIVTRPQNVDINTLCTRFCNYLEAEVKGIPNYNWVDVQTVKYML